MRGQRIERHVYIRGVRVGVRSRGDGGPTLAYQEPDADPRHIEAIEPSLDIESDVLSLSVLLPLEHALRNGCHSGVMAPLDGLERLGETLVVLVNLWRPLDIRSPCVIPTTVHGRERSSASFFNKRSDIADRFSIGIRSLLRLAPLTFALPSPPRLYLVSLKDGFGVEMGSDMSA